MKRRKKTNRIIFHHSLSNFGDADTIRRWHLDKGWEDIGYHYVVPRVGSFQKGRDYRYVGAHAFGRNGDSIGVCIVGKLNQYEPNINQLEMCKGIYHCCCRIYNKTLKIEFHRPSWMWNACPGKQLDRTDFKEIIMRGNPF